MNAGGSIYIHFIFLMTSLCSLPSETKPMLLSYELHRYETAAYLCRAYTLLSLFLWHTHMHAHTVSSPITHTDSRRLDFAPSWSLALKYTWSTWTLCRRWNEHWNHLSQLNRLTVEVLAPSLLIPTCSQILFENLCHRKSRDRLACFAACWYELIRLTRVCFFSFFHFF